jgi:hypothetical protein
LDEGDDLTVTAQETAFAHFSNGDCLWIESQRQIDAVKIIPVTYDINRCGARCGERYGRRRERYG